MGFAARNVNRGDPWGARVLFTRDSRPSHLEHPQQQALEILTIRESQGDRMISRR